MKISKTAINLIAISMFSLLSGCVQTPIVAPTAILSSISVPTQTPHSFSSITPASTIPSTNIPSPSLPIPTPIGSATITAAIFPIGPGGSDVIPHQIVRTSNNFLYIFANQQSSRLLRVYRTNNAGFPNTTSDFAAPIELTESSEPISVDAIYDGKATIHVLVNTRSGQVKDHPFDIPSNTFKPAIILASDGGTVGSELYVGTSGVSGMMDMDSILHVVYWTNDNHIIHTAYTYDNSANSLTPIGNFTQVDNVGNANHPATAISPLDNSLTVAWVSEAVSPAQILTRTRSSAGIWGQIEIASTAPVWTSPDNGINIDQGPSLVIDSAGTRHLTYIQLIDYTVGDYGRIHYVTNNGAGWTDQSLNAFSHDPALAINSTGTLYIIGHGHPLNPTCKSMDEMCIIKKTEDWENPVTFASPPSGFSFDSSPSVKWSVVGFNRPDIIEFIFFMTPYDNSTLYYGRLP